MKSHMTRTCSVSFVCSRTQIFYFVAGIENYFQNHLSCKTSTYEHLLCRQHFSTRPASNSLKSVRNLKSRQVEFSTSVRHFAWKHDFLLFLDIEVFKLDLYHATSCIVLFLGPHPFCHLIY
jgi:hypothetical protein